MLKYVRLKLKRVVKFGLKKEVLNLQIHYGAENSKT